MIRRPRPVILVLAMLVVATSACGTATPTTDPSNTASATAEPGRSADPGSGEPASTATAASGDLPADLVEAIADPTPERMSSAELALRDEHDRRIGLTALIGSDGQSWLQDQRSEAVRAALDAYGIETTALGPTRLASGSTASLDGDETAMFVAWFGSGIGAIGLVEQALGNIGGNSSPNTGTRQSTIQGNQGSQHIVTTVTTTFLTQVTGSMVVVDVDVTEHNVVTDRSTGAVVGTTDAQSHIHVEGQMCPDSNGIIEATVSNDVTSSGDASAGGVDLSTTSTATIRATVNAAAFLASEDRTVDTTMDGIEAGVRRQGSSSMNWTATYGAGGSSSTIASSSFTSQGDYTPSEAAATAGLMGLMQSIASDTFLKTAQKAWRGGKCVRIEATERSRKVRPREVVNFIAEPWHKIDGSRLDKPVVASFAGEASVTPVDTPVDAPASFTFTAARTKKIGRIELTSTSNRGIGKLPIQFEVEYQGWSINGSRTNAVGVTGTIRGKKCGDDPMGSWKATGTYDAFGFDGRQTWRIDITDSSIPVDVEIWTGTYTYADRSEGPYGVHQEYEATGTVRLVIDDTSGDVTMTLKEKTRRQRAWTDDGAKGWSKAKLNPPQDVVWTNDAQC